MGDLSKIFSKAYADNKAELAAFDMEASHKEQLTHLRAIVDELDASPDFYARFSLENDKQLQLRVGLKPGGASVCLDVRLMGDGERTAVMLERPESRHSGIITGDNMHDLRKQEGREGLCRELGRQLSFESVESLFQKNMRSQVKKPSP